MSNAKREILFGKFEIIECFKKDEHSGVYLANHTYLQKKIILKVLNTVTIPDQVIIQRFKREAKLLAKLNHPNIINVLDFGTHEDFFYISFEYFDGSSLRALLKKNKMNLEQKEYLLVQLLKGFHCAHEMGVIHRDIKPENIFVNENYELKIGDFGLAFDISDNFVTAQHTIVGTPCYMAPEQVEGGKITKQSDLFSMGIVALELFSGRNPFIGKDINETINNIISFNEDSISKDLSLLPEHLKNLISGLLKRNISERIASAKEALAFLNILELPARNYKSSINSKSIWVGAVLIIIVLFSTVIVLVFIPNDSPSTNSIVKSSDDTPSEYANINLDSMQIVNTDEKPIEQANDPAVTHPNSGENTTAAIEQIEEVKFGALHIECFPWAEVFIDSIKIDTTPLSGNLTLREGEHDLVLINPVFPEYREKIRIFDGELTSIKVNMDTLFGFVNFKIFPWGEVYIDDELLCQTPTQKPVRLFPGEYKAILKNPGAMSEEINLTIHQNDTTLVTHNFIVK